MMLILGVLSFLFSFIGLFLALWIIVPAPIFALLPLGVGAPEISPWLIALNLIGVILAWRSASAGSRLALMASLVALGLSVLPLLQLPSATQQAAQAMQSVFGADYQARISPSLQAQLRPVPFVLADALRGIARSNIRRETNIPFANPDHVSLKLNVYRPLQAGKNPTIVMIYGGAWRSGEPSANERFSEYIAAQGYTVCAIDYRHAPQYKFPAQLEDIKTALEFIRQRADQYDIDLTRIALLGRSAGGHLATLSAFAAQTLPIRAVVSYYGPVDLTEGYNNPPVPDPIDSRDVLRSFLGGTPQEFSELYRQASPYQQVKPSLPTTLLIYGKRDHVVKSKYGRDLYEKLSQTGNTVVFIEIPWSEHAFDAIFNGVGNQLALYYTERFLALTLRS